MKRIAELRKEKHLNQTGLGLLLNVSQKMISSYENGTHQPSIETLIRMSEIFNVSIDYIVGNTDIRSSVKKHIYNSSDEEQEEMLELFNSLDRDGRKKAIGVLFALKQLNEF